MPPWGIVFPLVIGPLFMPPLYYAPVGHCLPPGDCAVIYPPLYYAPVGHCLPPVCLFPLLSPPSHMSLWGILVRMSVCVPLVPRESVDSACSP